MGSRLVLPAVTGHAGCREFRSTLLRISEIPERNGEELLMVQDECSRFESNRRPASEPAEAADVAGYLQEAFGSTRKSFFASNSS